MNENTNNIMAFITRHLINLFPTSEIGKSTRAGFLIKEAMATAAAIEQGVLLPENTLVAYKLLAMQCMTVSSDGAIGNWPGYRTGSRIAAFSDARALSEMETLDEVFAYYRFHFKNLCLKGHGKPPYPSSSS